MTVFADKQEFYQPLCVSVVKEVLTNTFSVSNEDLNGICLSLSPRQNQKHLGSAPIPVSRLQGKSFTLGLA
jgi:hypothetical protein